MVGTCRSEAEGVANVKNVLGGHKFCGKSKREEPNKVDETDNESTIRQLGEKTVALGGMMWSTIARDLSFYTMVSLILSKRKYL